MNIYDEILNKYAQFLGYEGKVNTNTIYLLNERDKLERITQFNDRLIIIDKNSKKSCYRRRTVIAGYKTGFAYSTEDECFSGRIDLEMITFENLWKNKTPCVCFIIDPRNNTYKEITIDEAMSILASD
mgnify:FL=1